MFDLSYTSLFEGEEQILLSAHFLAFMKMCKGLKKTKPKGFILPSFEVKGLGGMHCTQVNVMCVPYSCLLVIVPSPGNSAEL